MNEDPMNDDPMFRTVAQLAEHRSPKPGVGGSIPSCPARFELELVGSSGQDGRPEGRGGERNGASVEARASEASLSEGLKAPSAKDNHRSPKPGGWGFDSLL